ncbi:restriction endonuclease subunit M [Bathymodiolus septemdierum thioautotrophic gill symbiont]|uniref:N-6 DNA methylase n=1 Tax=endosymbiont of Bathymodiolus septemdierum str. Myojin knoll TaxID=1303921 RepID=A0A0P0URR1_9GAMM|nr:N-6 DNA methylase [Bathymodiolus septemdierum thioautotrophic gill symbiont]BAS67657.1 N-6 DNA methylase [endosymbiont of Bathymodiolus septemdierum str. Myojin knoll]
MNTEALIQKAINKKIISFNKDRTRITYLLQNKTKSYKTEEIVQVDAYLKLIFDYNYPKENIKLFVPVKMGSDNREADIVVYSDKTHTKPLIVIECKKSDVSEAEYKQSVAQGFSYAVSIGADFVWATSNIKNEYYQVSKKYPQKHEEIANIPKLGGKVAAYKYAKNGNSDYFDLSIVSEDELTARFKQAHNALWGGGELNPSEAFDELDKLIFCKIWDERALRRTGEAYDFQIITESNNGEIDNQATLDNLAERIHKLYDKGKEKDPEVFKENIRLSPSRIKTVVEYLQHINLSATDLDSKGRAFETFMGSFFRGDFGQYFTPRPIVQFIVDALPITHESMVLDTSCGSGGFLLHALDKVRKEADEYYPDGIAIDGKKESAEHHNHWHDFAEKKLCGIEINEQIARTAKMNMIIHDDGHTNVIAADGLLPIDDIVVKNQNNEDVIIQQGITSLTQNTNFENNNFDFIITNPPFGSSIRQTEQAYMHQYSMAKKDLDWLKPNDKTKNRDNQSTEVLFIEKCHKYLKEGGYLAIVVPDGILTNSSLQYVRDNIEADYRIVAIVSMPQTAFSATGAGVKSSVMFLRKHTAQTTETIKAQKQSIKDDILGNTQFFKQLSDINTNKKTDIKNSIGFENTDNLEPEELNKTEAYKNWKKSVNEAYKSKIDNIKEKLNDKYLADKKSQLQDYDIFMAIAENIGYDATGKPTNNNELDFIGQELQRFIESLG